MANLQNDNHIQSIFQSSEFNDLNRDDFNKKFINDPNYLLLKQLKDLNTEILMSCFLTRNDLDFRGNKISGWSLNEKRGNITYEPPIGWIGIGIKVLRVYREDDWIQKNSRNEWSVAYQGITGGGVKKIMRMIIKGGFKAGAGQMFKDCEDILHPGQKVGTGVYFTPSIKVAEGYSTVADFGGEKYKIALMVRVKPDKIRKCRENESFWVLNGATDEVRPYRILFKKV